MVLLCLRVVLGATDIGVVGARRGLWLLRQRAAIKPVFEDRFDTLIGTGTKREGPLTGRFESLGAVAFAQPHDP